MGYSLTAGVMAISVDAHEVEQMLDRAFIELGPIGMRKLMRTLANAQTRSTMDNFDAQSFDGEAWPALSEVTAAQPIPGRRGGRGFDNILHPSGYHIRRTISSSSDETHARVFTPNPWAHVHNEGADLVGTAFGDITIPRRTFLGISGDDVETIELAVGWYLDGAIR